MGRCVILLLILAVALGSTGMNSGAAERYHSSGDPPKWIISSGMVPPLPNGSLLGLALALERGAASLWLDLVLTADDHLVLLSDSRIDLLTDVKTVFPERSRPDGSYYSFDFTLDELRQLTLQASAPEGTTPVSFSGAHLSVAALEDFLSLADLVSGDMNIPPTLIFVLRHGWRHRQEGKDLGAAALAAAASYQTRSGAAELIIGSYDPDELQQLAQGDGSAVPGTIGFMQLITTGEGQEVQQLEFGTYQPYNYDLLFTRFGLKAVSGYADTIGLDPETIFDASGRLTQPRFLDDAQTLGLRVVCNRSDSLLGQLLNLEPEPEALFEHLLFTVGFDGIVTSADRRARRWLADRSPSGGDRQDTIIERLIDQIGDSDGSPPPPLQSDTTR